MSIKDAILKAKQGEIPESQATPVSDKAGAIFRAEMPFKQKWDLIEALASELDQANKEDCYRYGCYVEGMHADAETEDDIRHMNSEAAWQV